MPTDNQSESENKEKPDARVQQFANLFQAAVDEAELNIESFDNGSVVLANAAGHRATLSLNNIYRVVLLHDFAEWPEHIAHYLEQAGPAAIAPAQRFSQPGWKRMRPTCCPPSSRLVR